MNLRILLFGENKDCVDRLEEWQKEDPLMKDINMEIDVTKGLMELDIDAFNEKGDLDGYSIILFFQHVSDDLLLDMVKYSSNRALITKMQKRPNAYPENHFYLDHLDNLTAVIGEVVMNQRSLLEDMIKRNEDGNVLGNQHKRSFYFAYPTEQSNALQANGGATVTIVGGISSPEKISVTDELPIGGESHQNIAGGNNLSLAAQLLAVTKSISHAENIDPVGDVLHQAKDSEENEHLDEAAPLVLTQLPTDDISEKMVNILEAEPYLQGKEQNNQLKSDETETPVNEIIESKNDLVNCSTEVEKNEISDESVNIGCVENVSDSEKSAQPNVSDTEGTYNLNEYSSTPSEPFTYERTRDIQRKLFTNHKWENHKKIGVWSPLPHMGVTTFIMNFAMFMAEQRIFVGVLEALRKDVLMKHVLKRYASAVPTDWVSYASTVHDTKIDASRANWRYRNVLFMPLDDKDTELKWTTDLLDVYMDAPEVMDVTLVDLPNGEMARYTLDGLNYLEELWIVVDDTFQEITAWRQYIAILTEKYHLKVYLIFNKEYDFSQVERIEQVLNVPVLAKLPAMHYEVMRNYYERVPLFYTEGARAKLQKPFVQLGKHVMGEEFISFMAMHEGVIINEKERLSFKEKMLQLLTHRKTK